MSHRDISHRFFPGSLEHLISPSTGNITDPGQEQKLEVIIFN